MDCSITVEVNNNNIIRCTNCSPGTGSPAYATRRITTINDFVSRSLVQPLFSITTLPHGVSFWLRVSFEQICTFVAVMHARPSGEAPPPPSLLCLNNTQVASYEYGCSQNTAVAVTQATPCVGEQPCGNNMPVGRGRPHALFARDGRTSKRCGPPTVHIRTQWHPEEIIYTDFD